MNSQIYPLQLKVYIASIKFFQKIMKVLNAFFIGFWLGILKRENLYLIDALYYDNTQKYRDFEYNCSGLWRWETKVLEQYFPSCHNLLVAGVGGGREVLALRKLGYKVDGFECNPNLVEFANRLMKQEGFPANIQLVSRDKCSESQNNKYDGIIIGWGAYMLIQGRTKRIDFLKTIKEQAQQNSPILLSFYCHPTIKKYHQIIAQVGNLIRCILGRERLEPGDSLVPMYVHFFTQDEIDRELTEAGFKLVMYCTDEYGHAVGIAG